jgi:hypothetical protein
MSSSATRPAVCSPESSTVSGTAIFIYAPHLVPDGFVRFVTDDIVRFYPMQTLRSSSA